MKKNLKFVMLLDCYGELLTEHQKNIMELYYCDDLSLSEIGNPLGITRQAVRDNIKRAESILLNYEDKLRFAEKLENMRRSFDELIDSAQEIKDAELKNKITEQINNIVKYI